MHICHIIGRLIGGPVTSIRHLALDQIAQGHEVSCVFGSKEASVETLRPYFPEPIRLIPFDVGREIVLREDLRALRQLTAILRTLQPDIAHLHSSKAGTLGRLSCRKLGIPNVYSPRGISFLRRDVSKPTKALHMGIEAAMALIGGPVVACSAGEHAAIRRLPCDVTMIPNQIDIAEIEGLADGPAPPPGPFHVAISSRIEAQKNPALVARLIASAPAEWRWTWVGGGPLEHLLHNIPNLRITGWLDRPTALKEIRHADVLLHATAWEGMPHSILEAMALARPVVTTNVEGNRDLVEDGKTGLVCQDEEALLSALRRLAEMTPIERQRMGEAGRDKVAQLHNPAAISDQWTALYHRVLGS